jgi:hypothetical protein
VRVLFNLITAFDTFVIVEETSSTKPDRRQIRVNSIRVRILRFQTSVNVEMTQKFGKL